MKNVILNRMRMRIQVKKRRKYLMEYLLREMQTFINEMIKKKQGRDLDLIFCYLNFLIEIQQSKILFYVEIIRLEKCLDLNPLQMGFANQIYEKADEVFHDLNISYARVYHHSNDNSDKYLPSVFKEENIKNQSVQLANLLEAISFDELLNNVEKEYYNILQQKGDILILLSADFIHLQILKKKCKAFIKGRNKLRNKLQKLNLINSKSCRLNNMLDGYCAMIGFGVQKNRLFNKNDFKNNIQTNDNLNMIESNQFKNDNAKKNQNYENQQYNYLDKKIQNSLPLFSKSICIVFITLIDRPGTIKKLQNSFSSIFGYSLAEALEKDISLVIPKLIGQFHYNLLVDFFTQPNINSQNRGRGQLSSLIGRDNQGWAVPITVHFKSDSVGVDDCGLTGYIEKIKNDYNYIMVSEHDFKIQIMSKNLYDTVFQNYTHKNQLTDIFLIQIIPMLKYFEKQRQNSHLLKLQNSFDTIAILPKVEQNQNNNYAKSSLYFFKQNSYENQIEELQKIDISDHHIFRVRFKLISIRNQYFKYHTIEMHQFRQIKNLNSINDCLKFLQYQFYNLLAIKINFNKQFQHLQSQQNMLACSQFQLNENTLSMNDNYEDSKFQLRSRERLQLSQVDSIRLDMQDTQQFQDHSQQQQYQENNQQTFQDNNQYSQEQQQQIIKSKLAYTTYQSQIDSIKLSLSPYNNLPTEVETRDPSSKDPIPKYSSQFQYDHSFKIPSKFQPNDHHSQSQQIKKDNDRIYDDQQQSQRNQLEMASPTTLLSSKNCNSNTQLFFSTKKYVQQNNQQNGYPLTVTNRENIDEEEEDDSELKNGLPPLSSQRMPFKQSMKQTEEKEKKSTWLSIIKQKMKNKQLKQKENSNKNIGSQFNINNNFEDEELDQQNNSKKNKQIQFNFFNKYMNKLEDAENLNELKIKQIISNHQLPDETNHISGQQYAFDDQDDQSETQKNNKNQDKSLQDGDDDDEEEDNSLNSSMRNNNTDVNKPNKNQNQNNTPQNKINKKIRNKNTLKNNNNNNNNELQAGVSSSQNNSTQSVRAKKGVKKNIFQKRNSKLLIFLRVFGFFSASLVFAITFIVYYEMILNFQLAQDTFNFVTWPLIFRCNYSFSSHYMAILQIIRRKVFQNSSFDEAYEQAIKDRVDFSVSELSSLLEQFQQEGQDKLTFFNEATSQTIKMILNKDLASIKGNKLVNNPEDKIILNIKLSYFLQTSVGFIYRYSTAEDNLYEQIARLDNVSLLIQYVSMMDDSIKSQCESILDRLETQALLLLLMVIFTLIVLLSILFPFYYNVQRNCQNVLQLFATLQQEHIQNMIYPISQQLLYAYQQHKIRLPPMIQQSFFIKKKKNISLTDNLSKFRVSIAIVSVVIFIALMVQPITNYLQIIDFSGQALSNIMLLSKIFYHLQIRIIFQIISSFYNSDYLLNLKKIGTLYELRAQSISSTSQNYQYLLYRMDPTYLLYNPSYYVKRIPNLLIQNDEKLLGVIQVLAESYEYKSRYKQDQFNQFFYNIIYGDVCETMRKFPEYVKPENYVDYDSCIETRHGMLKKGLTLAFKDFLSEFQELSGIFNITDPVEFKTKAIEWENRVDLRDFDDLSTFLSRSLNSMKDFLLQMMTDQLIYNQNIQTILLIYQYATLLLVFYFGWVNFYNRVSKDLYEIRTLLTIINIEVILENPYIISFLNK